MSGTSERGWGGSLVLSPGMLVYFGPGGSASEHRHHTVQIVRSFDAPFELEEGSSARSLTHTAVIASGVRHRVHSDAAQHAIVLVEPEARGRQDFGSERAGEIVDAVAALPAPFRDPDAIAAFGAGVAVALGREQTPISLPVRHALESIERQLPERPRLAHAAGDANLSPSRLTHLFSAEIGVPFRRYVLWRRFWLLAREVSAGGNLTSAALAAGFSDSAHCSRVFRATFGVPASAILSMEISWVGWPQVVSRNVQVVATPGT